MPKRRSWTVETGPRPKRTAWLKKRQPPRRRNAIVRVPRNKLAFPQRMATKLRYVQEEVYDVSSTTSVGKVAWRANSIYDPYEPTASTHQPRGFDEFMATYSMYTVTGSSISVSFAYQAYDGPSLVDSTDKLIKVMGNAASTATQQIQAQSAVCCGINKSTEKLASGTYAQTMEKDKNKWKYMTPHDGVKTVSTSSKISDFYGPFGVGAADFSGTDASNPNNEVFYNVWVGKINQNNTDCITRVLATILIEYDVVFTEPKPLSAS